MSINDLPQHIRTWSSNIFADHSAICTNSKSFMETKCALQSSVYDAGRWFDNNNLLINIKNTTCMLIAIQGNPEEPRRALEERTLSLELSGITLEQFQTTRTLVFNSMTSCSGRHMLKSYAGIFIRNLQF